MLHNLTATIKDHSAIILSFETEPATANVR